MLAARALWRCALSRRGAHCEVAVLHSESRVDVVSDLEGERVRVRVSVLVKSSALLVLRLELEFVSGVKWWERVGARKTTQRVRALPT